MLTIYIIDKMAIRIMYEELINVNVIRIYEAIFLKLLLKEKVITLKNYQKIMYENYLHITVYLSEKEYFF